MIIAKTKSMEEIEDMLKDYSRIAVIGCGGCVSFYRVGSAKEVEEVSKNLEKIGKKVVYKGMIARQCYIGTEDELGSLSDEEILKKVSRAIGKAEYDFEAILSLACGVGVQNMSRFLRKPVLPAQNTFFMGIKNMDENKYNEFCIGCGNCMLHLTAGICPIARCPKSLLNGSCGGIFKGKCEVDRERDCAWVLIYNRLKAMGKLDNIRRIFEPKDFSKASHTRRIDI